MSTNERSAEPSSPWGSGRTGTRTRRCGPRWRAEHEAQPAGGEALGEELRQAVLQDRDFALVQTIDAVDVDVRTHDVVAQVGQADRSGQADIPGPDDRNITHEIPVSLGHRVAHGRGRGPCVFDHRGAVPERLPPVPMRRVPGHRGPHALVEPDCGSQPSSRRSFELSNR